MRGLATAPKIEEQPADPPGEDVRPTRAAARSPPDA